MKKLVMIADDDQDVVELLSRRCEQMGLLVVTANDSISALAEMEKQKPDVAILDVHMPGGSGISLLERMISSSSLQNLPVIMLTASTNETTVRKCHQHLAYYVLKSSCIWSRVRPLLTELLDNATLRESITLKNDKRVGNSQMTDPNGRNNELMETVFAVLGAEEGELVLDNEESNASHSDTPWVLSIEDDADVALALRLRLKEFGVHVIPASAGAEGYRRAFLDDPCAIILDYELPQGNGDYVLRRLKESKATRDIPVIVLTGRREASIERQMRGLGASEFLNKPLDWKRLRAALEVHLHDSSSLKQPVTATCGPSF